jgi:hypothetical protein
MSGPASPEVTAEAGRLVEAFLANGLESVLIGGAAVRMLCDAARVPPLAREIEDLDFVVGKGQQEKIAELLTGLGYVEDRETNLLQGHRRLVFHSRGAGFKVDAFVGRFEMCHTIEIVPGRPGIADVTSLLLTKLQIVELTEKDTLDLLALLHDHELGTGPDCIDADRIEELASRDWGIYTTITDGLEVIGKRAAETPGCAVAAQRVAALDARLREAKKSRNWRLRARIGRRKRWYELPEEVDEAQELGSE